MLLTINTEKQLIILEITKANRPTIHTMPLSGNLNDTFFKTSTLFFY